MKGRSRSAVALVAVLAALAVAVIAASGAAADTTINYDVNPSYVYGFGIPGAFPSPSTCVARYGFTCYTPQEIRTAYDIPSTSTGAGQTIVIVDAYGSP